MQSLNIAILIGRLTKDPDVRFTQTGKQVTRFTVAVDRSKGQDGNRETDYIPVVTWDKLAENCGTYLGKGRLVAVEGRIQMRKYVDSKTGQNRTAFEVVADNVQFLDRGNGHSAPAEEIPSDDEFPTDDLFNDDAFDDEPPF